MRWIICHNPDEAERDQAARDAAIARITAELNRITAARTRAREQARTRRASATMTTSARRKSERSAERDEAAHLKAECALREHPALGRWLRQTPLRAPHRGPEGTTDGMPGDNSRVWCRG